MKKNNKKKQKRISKNTSFVPVTIYRCVGMTSGWGRGGAGLGLGRVGSGKVQPTDPAKALDPARN